MDTSQAYIVIALVALALIAGARVVVGRGRPRARLSPLSVVALALVVAGLFFEARWVGYSLLGLGVLIAVLDLARQRVRT